MKLGKMRHESMAKLATANNKAVSRLSAQAVVMSKFVDAVVPCLTASQSVQVSQMFRAGIESPASNRRPESPRRLSCAASRSDQRVADTLRETGCAAFVGYGLCYFSDSQVPGCASDVP